MMNQFSPTVTPEWPARGLGISPCCIGFDHSIYDIAFLNEIILKFKNYHETEQCNSRISLYIVSQFEDQEHADR